MERRNIEEEMRSSQKEESHVTGKVFSQICNVAYQGYSRYFNKDK